MKFATPSWEDSPKNWAEFRQSLVEHYKQMQGVLSPDILALAELRGVDDGLIVEVRHDRNERTLRIVLRCGDNQIGYYDLVLTYEEAEISPSHEQILTRVARSTRDSHYHESDLVRQELDVTLDGRIEHRLEFHVYRRPNVWFAIRCRALNWERISQCNRDLPALSNRFFDVYFPEG